MTKPKGPSFVERVREDASRYLQELLVENERLRADFVTVQEEISGLANLFVAVSSVTGTRDRARIVSAIEEVVVNIVGSEEVAIFALDGKSLTLVSSVGVPADEFKRVELGSGVIGQVAQSGEAYIPLEDDVPRESCAGHPVNACVPLTVDGVVTGVIAVFRLLQQKPRLTESDVELLRLLGTHGGASLACARS
ncbi:MAG: GAF domain-containing protein [Myxococcota bacterium]